MEIEASAIWVLSVVLFPLWLAAGVGDYVCHRATKIEATSGVIESVSHLALASLMGTGVLALMFLEMNAFLLALLVALFVGHEVVTQLDLRWAVPLREVGPAEQQIHSFLEAIPFAAVTLVSVVVISKSNWDFAFALKDGTNWTAVTAMLAAMTVFGAIPYWEEFWRCLRHAPAIKS